MSKFEEAGEWACDDLVMDSTDQDGSTYTSALLQVAESSLMPLSGTVAAQGGVLSRRIKRLITPRFKEETVMKKMIVPTLLMGLAVAQLVRIEAVAGDEQASPPAKIDSGVVQHDVEAKTSTRPAYNKKYVYVLYELSANGDYLTRLPWKPSTTVSDAIKSLGTSFSQPIDFSTAKIWVARPAPNGIGDDQILPVDWKAIRQSTDKSMNHRLLPGDRVFVSTQKKIASSPMPLGRQVFPKDDNYYRIRRVKLFAPGQPSPQVKLEIQVIEDKTGSLAEFEPLKKGFVMTAEKAAVLGALRILRKNDLIDLVSEPTIVSVFGRTAYLTIAGSNPDGSDKSQPLNGLRIEMRTVSSGKFHVFMGKTVASRSPDKARINNEIEVKMTPVPYGDSSLRVEVKMQVKIQNNTTQLDIAMIIAPGKTVILRIYPKPGENPPITGKHPAVYVVLTPTMLP